MSTINDGGPAFAGMQRIRRAGYDTNEFEPVNGMSLRDYFIAHAPAEPQPWFQPAMTTERPALPKMPTDPSATKQQIGYVEEYASVMNPEEAATPALRSYVLAYRAQVKLIAAHDAECQKQFYVQWPAAWADAMLKARSASHG